MGLRRLLIVYAITISILRRSSAGRMDDSYRVDCLALSYILSKSFCTECALVIVLAGCSVYLSPHICIRISSDEIALNSDNLLYICFEMDKSGRDSCAVHHGRTRGKKAFVSILSTAGNDKWRLSVAIWRIHAVIWPEELWRCYLRRGSSHVRH